VTDPSGTQGVLTYVNDLKTHADILRDTGVGRVMLDKGEQTTVFPGVTVRNEAHRVVVDADDSFHRRNRSAWVKKSVTLQDATSEQSSSVATGPDRRTPVSTTPARVR
jgi:hypothetical protein